MSRTSTAPAPTAKPAAPVQQQMQTASTSLPKDKVAARAYHKWLQSGCPHGCDKQHWLEAEAELKAEMMKSGPARK